MSLTVASLFNLFLAARCRKQTYYCSVIFVSFSSVLSIPAALLHPPDQ
jgi:hypothetical protein